VNITYNISSGLIASFSETGSPTPEAGQAAATISAADANKINSAPPNSVLTYVNGAVVVTAGAAPVFPDFSTIDGLSKSDKALGLAIAALTGKTIAQVKSAYVTAWNSLP
jgi:hypothetical protein